MDNFTVSVLMILLVVFSAFAFFFGTSMQDRADCGLWANQATEYPGFYITKWQAQECAYYNIPVNAPVK